MEGAGRYYNQELGHFNRLTLGDRVAENEVDVKSVFRRIHQKGMNPYAALDLMERMRAHSGDTVSKTHTMISSRINTLELELTGMARVIGEKLSKKSSNKIVTTELQSYLRSESFKEIRKREIKKMMQSYDEEIEEFLKGVKELESLSEPSLGQNKIELKRFWSKIKSNYEANKERLYELVDGLVSPEELLDLKLRHEASFAESLFGKIENIFGEDPKFRHLEQYEIIQNIIPKFSLS